MTNRQTCQRWPKCATMEPHEGKRHNDPRDELYDGPSTLLQVLPLAIRNQARTIVDQAPALIPELVDIAEHVQRLRDQVTHVSVDKDRSVREASKRALDCGAHGEVIQGLEAQVAVFDASARRSEAGRLALLSFLHAVDQMLAAPPPNLTVEHLLAGIAAAVRTTHAAHHRAWKS